MSLRAKLQRWAVQAGGVLLTQAGVQAIGAVTGLMLVRWMPKDEYAWLTICGSLLATMGLLADGGISTAITSMSGRVVGDKYALAQVADACLAVRNRLALLSLVLTLPPFYVLFLRTDLPPGMAALLVGTAALMVWPVTSSKFLPVTLRIAGHLKSTQIMEINGALLRCGLTALVLVAGWKQVYPAFLATLISVCLHVWLADRGVKKLVGIEASTQARRAEVWSFVRALYANHIFLCVQGQIVTWIISFSSGVREIADVGALSRLTVFFAIFGSMFHYVVLPSIATTKCPLQVRAKFIVSIGGTLAAVLLVIGAACVMPRPFLWILGASYSHLGTELPLAFAVQGLGVMNGVIWTFMQVRGWVSLSWLNIPLTLLGYVFGVLVADLSNVAGVLIMSGLALLPPLLWALCYTWTNLHRDVSSARSDVTVG